MKRIRTRDAMDRRNAQARAKRLANRDEANRKAREVYAPRYAKRRKAWKYGLNVSDLAVLEAKKFCQACARAFYGHRTALTAQCIDHDHRTGSVRGAICRRCNIVLGLVQDDKGLLGALRSYL